MFTVLALPRPSLPSVLPPPATPLMLAAPTSALTLPDHCSNWPRLPAPAIVKKDNPTDEDTVLASSQGIEFTFLPVVNMVVHCPNKRLPSPVFAVWSCSAAEIFSSQREAELAYAKHLLAPFPKGGKPRLYTCPSLAEAFDVLGLPRDKKFPNTAFFCLSDGPAPGIYTQQKTARKLLKHTPGLICLRRHYLREVLQFFSSDDSSTQTPSSTQMPPSPQPILPTRSPYVGKKVKHLSLYLLMPRLELPAQYYCVRQAKSAAVFSSLTEAQTTYRQQASAGCIVFLEHYTSFDRLLSSLGLSLKAKIINLRFYSVVQGDHPGLYSSRKVAKAARGEAIVGESLPGWTTIAEALAVFNKAKKKLPLKVETPLQEEPMVTLTTATEPPPVPPLIDPPPVPYLNLVVIDQRVALFSQVSPEVSCTLSCTPYGDVACAYEALITHPHFERDTFMAPLPIECTTSIPSYRLATTEIPSSLGYAEVNVVFSDRLEHLRASEMWIFTDGSAQLDRIVASARLHSQAQKAEMSWYLESGFSLPHAVLEAETLAANNALLEAMHRRKTLVRLFTDSAQMIQSVQSAIVTTAIQAQFLATVKAFCQTGRLILTKVKAHHGIVENERVDALTRATFASFSPSIS